MKTANEKAGKPAFFVDSVAFDKGSDFFSKVVLFLFETFALLVEPEACDVDRTAESLCRIGDIFTDFHALFLDVCLLIEAYAVEEELVELAFYDLLEDCIGLVRELLVVLRCDELYSQLLVDL